MVLERGRVGETWRTQRWDSFAVNTPNWMNGLPGSPYDGPDPFGFMDHTELAESFDAYVDRFDLPVRTGVTVTSVGTAEGSGRYLVTAESDEGVKTYEAASVVIASGIAHSPRIPDVGSEVPAHILQLHTGGYRSAEALPAGAVVVVGGGQSGGQIVEDLLRAGRAVYFSISKVGRVPRRHRGRDFMEWWVDMGLWDVDVDSVDDPAMITMANPLTSGVGPMGHTIGHQQLARDGAHLMGRLVDVQDGVLFTDDRVMEYIRYADDRSRQLKAGIDAFIEARGLEAPEAEEDEADLPLASGEEVPFLTQLDLVEAGVGSIIWCTGFGFDFSWIDSLVTDERGMPAHHKGIGEVPGMYFVGFQWLASRKSGIVYGIDDDARRITDAIVARSAVR